MRNVWRVAEYVSEGLTLWSRKAALFNGITPAGGITGGIVLRAYLSAILCPSYI